MSRRTKKDAAPTPVTTEPESGTHPVAPPVRLAEVVPIFKYAARDASPREWDKIGSLLVCVRAVFTSIVDQTKDVDVAELGYAVDDLIACCDRRAAPWRTGKR